MGLDISPGNFSCSYGSFNQWRGRISIAIGLGPLSSYIGHGGKTPWPTVADEPIVALLNHSDCDGKIEHGLLLPMADRLRQIDPILIVEDGDDTGWFEHLLREFIESCDAAHAAGVPLDFR